MNAPSNRNRTAAALRAILVAYVCLALTYSFADRLKLGPDEPAHFIYVRSIATSLAPPSIANSETHTEDSVSSHEGHQPPLYYALMAIPYAVLNALGASSDVIWRVLRFLTIPLGACWIYAVWVLAREFFGKDGYALAATGLTALLPTAAYSAAVVNNDILIALLFTLGLVPILRYFKTGVISANSGIVLGVVIGLAALAKAQGLILLPVFFVAALLVCRREQYANPMNGLRAVAIVTVSAFAVCGWWFIWRWMEYGTPFPHSLFRPIADSPLTALMAAPLLVLDFVGYLTARLWGHLIAPYWLIEQCIGWPRYFHVLIAITALAVAGFVIRLRRNGDIDRRSLWLLVFAVVLQYVLYVHYVLAVDRGATDQGRLFLSVAAIVSICLVLGFDGFLRSTRARLIGAAAGATALLALNVFVIVCAIGLRY